MKLLEKFKKTRNDKGFTLVELIVVLVILAILAAILVPALLGYIDKAKEQQDVLNAKSYLTAIQAKASEKYASDTSTASPVSFDTDDIADIIKMADAPVVKLYVGTDAVAEGDSDTVKAHKNYTITYVAYRKDTNSKYLVFNGKSWTGVDVDKFSVSTSAKELTIPSK